MGPQGEVVSLSHANLRFGATRGYSTEQELLTAGQGTVEALQVQVLQYATNMIFVRSRERICAGGRSLSENLVSTVFALLENYGVLGAKYVHGGGPWMGHGWAKYGHSTARQGRQHQSDRGAAGGAAVPAMRSSGEDVPLRCRDGCLGMSICSVGL